MDSSVKRANENERGGVIRLQPYIRPVDERDACDATALDIMGVADAEPIVVETCKVRVVIDFTASGTDPLAMIVIA